MKLADVDSKKLLPLLESLSAAIEEILLAGLTAASDATRKTLGVTFQEASRMRLLRLGATLRVANEEIGRFTRNEADFSKQRLSFFLGRAWLLSRGLSKAVRESDDGLFGRLLHVPESRPLKRARVVTMGIIKKHVKDSFCSFDFRLRTFEPTQDLPEGQSLVWSCVFPLKPGVEIPPEGFLHLPQKQEFKPHILLEGNTIEISHARVSIDDRGSGRLILGEKSQVLLGDEFTDWSPQFRWNAEPTAKHVEEYQPGPLDLEIDLQEEIALDDWAFVADEWQSESRKGQELAPVVCRQTQFDLAISESSEGDALRTALKEMHDKKHRPLLFGLMHYAACRLVVQPLTEFDGDKPTYLTISDKDVDRKALLAALRF